MSQEYWKIKSKRDKEITYSVNLEPDKRKKSINRYVTINGSFPRPDPRLMKLGISYINDAEKVALEKEETFNDFVKKMLFVLLPIEFDGLPPEAQKRYDLDLYKKLQVETIKAEEVKEDGG